MATVKHVSSKNKSYQSTLNYLEFESKDGKLIEDENGFYVRRKGALIESLNTSIDTWSIDCWNTNNLFGNKNHTKEEVKQHQYIISFSPNDKITTEQAMEEGKKWAKEFFGGHQCLIAVHEDGNNHSGNIHIHIVINSVRALEEAKGKAWHERPADYKAGSKHRSSAKFTREFKRAVMNRCKELNLHQVDLLKPAKVKVTDKEYKVKQRGKAKNSEFQTHKDYLRECIIKVAKATPDREERLKLLKVKYGIEHKVSRGSLAFKHPERDGWIRERALGTDFKLDDIKIAEALHEDKAAAPQEHSPIYNSSGYGIRPRKKLNVKEIREEETIIAKPLKNIKKNDMKRGER